MDSLNTSDFSYDLPQELIAQTPDEPRDHSRLLVLDRADLSLTHQRFYDLPRYLRPGDIMVFNNSRVFRARLFGTRLDTGNQIELLLLRRLSGSEGWETLTRSSKKVRSGLKIKIEGSQAPETKETSCIAEVTGTKEGGIRVVHFSNESILPVVGEVPLPPYIHTPLIDPERYQTVYADKEGSAAAPTAGLHFTRDLLNRIQAAGVECLFVTLHVGLNTFRPVHVDNALQHPVYPEYGIIDKHTADRINLAKSEGHRIICVGTTSVRLVESAVRANLTARQSGKLEPIEGWMSEFIYPGYEFKIVDALITNFHLPKSTLMMLVSAFAGREFVLKAYHEAILQNYRFYSFGDAMLVL